MVISTSLNSMRICGAFCAGAVCLLASVVLSQEFDEDEPEQVVSPVGGNVEEVRVVGQNNESDIDVETERIIKDVTADFLDSEFIDRVGDSDAGALLRRMVGLTLVDGKFVYVRGLGERYSSAQLNGSTIPSPDITRNVVPLDIFPAEIIDSLAVQKGYAPDASASFGGGNVDIRTKKIPETGLFKIGLKTGSNSEGGDGWTYNGGSDDRWGVDDGTRALSNEIARAIDQYEGNFSPFNLLQPREGNFPFASLSEARQANHQLATFLNRNVDLDEKELPYDIEGSVMGAYRHYVNDDLDIGFMAIGSYSTDWRNYERLNRRISNPDTDFSQTIRTTEEANVVGSVNLGIRLTHDHEIGSISMLLRNTEDDASSARTCSQGQFNDCFDDSNPTQGRVTSLRFEQREMILHQFGGRHELGLDTLQYLGRDWEFLEFVEGTQFIWYYTDALAKTDLPHEVRISGRESLDSPNGQPIDYEVRSSGTAAEFRYSKLTDEVLTYGFDLVVPLVQNGIEAELSVGYDYLRKDRDYKQTSFGLGSTSQSFRTISEALPSEVFSDKNVMNPDYGFLLLLGVGEFGSESYKAFSRNEATYGKFDLLFHQTWRLSGGLRQEFFKQFSLPYDYLEYQLSPIGINSDEDAGRFTETIMETDDVYPALAFTYINPGFWANEFQFRAGWSETVARPDIREMSESTFIDPITEARVRGNSELSVSDITNLDMRLEWFWNSGDTFTVSAFHKDIANPIETVQGGATEDNIRFNFINAENASVYGTEVEFRKGLGFLASRVGDWAETLYVAGNTTLSDSEIFIPPGAGIGNITNEKRRLTQHSQYVVNLQIAYDSFDAKTAAGLIYNVVGERIYFAGVDGFDDGFEQPFHSLDFVFSYYPTERLSFKFRTRNILGSSVVIEQDGTEIIKQEVGTSVLFNVKWDFTQQ